MRMVTASVMALLLAMPLVAQEPQVQERERQHVVRTGDTLWDLAGRYFANPFQWPAIHEANTRIVADPHWIYPEQVLVIPGLREMVEMAPDAPVAFQPPRPPPPARSVFYRESAPVTRDGPTVLAEPLSEQTPVSPAQFYRAEYLAAPSELPVVGRVIRTARDMDHPSDLHQSAHPHDQLYLSYVSGAREPAVGDRLIIAEIGRDVRPAGQGVRVIVPRAIVRVLDLEREAVRVTIEEQFGRVVRDFVALPLEFFPDFLTPAAEPVADGHDLNGRIMEFAEDSPLPNRMTRAFIDMGRGHGVQVGDIFEAYAPARPMGRRGEWVPEESVAELRVIRVTDTSATVVVDEIETLQLEPGIPVRRVRKMP